MSGHEFDAAQADADDVSPQLADTNTAGCCGPCDNCEAYTWKQSCGTRRLSAGGVQAPLRQAWRRYQNDKCGPLEYNIYGSWLAGSALRIDARTALLADGLAPQEPPNADPRAKVGCCLLEAKWSTPNRNQALYVGRSTFVRTARRKAWLVARHRRSQLSPFGRRIRLPAFAAIVWQEAWNRARIQATGYQGFCESTSTPYTNFLYICGQNSFVRDYHRRMMVGLMRGKAIHSPFGGHDWKTSGRPRGC